MNDVLIVFIVNRKHGVIELLRKQASREEMASQGFSGTFILYFKAEKRDIFVIHLREQGISLLLEETFQNNFGEQWNLLMRIKAKKLIFQAITGACNPPVDSQ